MYIHIVSYRVIQDSVTKNQRCYNGVAFGEFVGVFVAQLAHNFVPKLEDVSFNFKRILN
jgi:hypothetical protein